MIFKLSVLKQGFISAFIQIWEKKLTHFWLLKTKRKGSLKKFGKTCKTFEYSKLGYISVFMKIWEKSFLVWLLSNSWRIEAKIKMKKFLNTCAISKLTTLWLEYTSFLESEKIWLVFEWFSTHWDKSNGEDEEFPENDLDFWTLHPKIRS